MTVRGIWKLTGCALERGAQSDCRDQHRKGQVPEDVGDTQLAPVAVTVGANLVASKQVDVALV